MPMKASSHLKAATAVTDLLENRFRVFGFKFGLEPLLGLFPGIGDVLSFIVSFYLVWIAFRLRLPQPKINQMIANIVFDFVIGLVPLFGDIGDFMFRANAKNLRILRSYTMSDIVEGEVVE